VSASGVAPTPQASGSGSTWEKRMAHRQVDRAHAKAIETHEAECAAAEHRATLAARFDAFCEARNGTGWYYNHSGSFAHRHYAHGNGIFDAATRELLGIFSIVLEDDMPPAPKSCPICDDFKPEEWQSPVPLAEGKERSDHE
jgi:hypothetical protein